MIFPPESVIELRRELAAKMPHGGDGTELFGQALAVDPHAPAALRYLALHAERERDLAKAAELGRRLIAATPTSHEGYRLMGRVLADQALAAGYAALGQEKLAYASEEELEALGRTAPVPAPGDSGGEPEAVTTELEPHRLIHELYAAGTDAVPASLLDRVVARGADCAPLLLGVLNEFGEHLLEEEDDPPFVIRALALLGEIGDPANLGPIARFFPLDDSAIAEAAHWAFTRISHLKPAESLAELGRLATGAEALEISGLAQQISFMHDTPGRGDALLALAANLDDFEQGERDLVLVSMVACAHLMEGPKGEMGRTIEERYGSQFSRAGRKELEEIRGEVEIARREILEAKEATLHEICQEAFEMVDEGPVHAEPKPGRNDPCWCGSGKKYKKCHLDSDQG